MRINLVSLISFAQFTQTQCVFTSLKSNQHQRKPSLVISSMKKIYNHFSMGVSRRVTSMVTCLSEEKWWQTKAFKCSHFLHTSVKIDVLLCCATNYPQREKQLAADSWTWGIHSLWRNLIRTDRLVCVKFNERDCTFNPRGSASSLLVQLRHLRGIFPPTSRTFFTFFI